MSAVPSSPLVRSAVALRRHLPRGVLVSLLLLQTAWLVAFSRAGSTLFFAGWASLTLVALLLRRKGLRRAPEGGAFDFALFAYLSLGLHAALLRFDGGLEGHLSPAIFVFCATVAAFAKPLSGGAVIAYTVALEAGIRFVTLGEHEGLPFVLRAAFVVAFYLLNFVFLRGELLRIRSLARAHVERELGKMKDDARRYRLLGPADGLPEEVRADRKNRAAVEEIHASVHYALDLLRQSLDLHTAALLWLSDAGTHLRISEIATASDTIRDAPFPAGDGVLGAAISKKTRVNLAHLKPHYKIPYYEGPCRVQSLAAIPVLDGSELRGLLVMDRIADAPFTPHEEEIAAQAARFCLRAIQNERVFLQLERAKIEQGKLYRAAQALGAARTEKEVVAAAVSSAREMTSIDLAAVTMFDESTRTHEVCAIESAEGDAVSLLGARFSHNAGLVSMVVQNRFSLPYRGDFDPTHQVVLTRKLSFPDFPSLLVLPLLLRDRALGTLILGARKPRAFSESVRPTLEVLASHLAVSLANARMMHKLETMATTDSLTGLLNKRAMLEVATEKVLAAARFHRKLSVLVVDIDHFKRVNDTHGHDVGDQVIRGLGKVLTRQKRQTDSVARFGGEEFVVVCEQTDEKGALLLAERIREDLKRTVFHGTTGAFSVTCSLGVATFPLAGESWEQLFRAADEALYVSKRGGRDRVTAFSIPASPKSETSRRGVERARSAS